MNGIEELTGLVKDVQVEMQKGNEAVVARLSDMEKKGSTLEAWLKEVEGKVTKQMEAGGVGPLGWGVGGNLMSVIPQRHRFCLDLFARSGMQREKAIKTVAIESWLKNSILLHNPAIAARLAPKLLEEMDAIERAFGFRPVGAESAAEQRAAMQEDTSSEGGALVPVPVEAEVLRMAEDSSVMRSLCRVVPMTTKAHSFPKLDSNLTVSIIPEEGTIATSEPTTGTLTLQARKFAVRAIASMELVQDSAIGILALLIGLMSEKYGLKEDQQILEGTGASGEFTGVGAASGVNEIYAAGASAGNGALFTPAQALAQKWKARKRFSRRGAAWVAAPEIVAQMEGLRFDVLASGDKLGGFMYTPANAKGEILADGGEGPDGVLHGFPIYAHSEIDVARTVGSAGNCSNMYFGPWKNAVIIGDLLGLLFGVSEHTQWATGQLDLRMIKRTAGLVGVPTAMTKQTGLKIA